MNEWNGRIFTSEKALTNNERLALWILKRSSEPLYFKSFTKAEEEAWNKMAVQADKERKDILEGRKLSRIDQAHLSDVARRER